MDNLFWNVEMALLDKKFQKGLSSHPQSNCKVTLTDDGYHIYRPPNLIYDSNNHNETANMWGGLRIINDYNWLQKGHTYIVLIDIKGRSTNPIVSRGWVNQMGWSGGGLNPTPSNVSYSNFGSNFEIDDVFYYKWTITDDLYKVCTTTYSYFIEGETYLSYKDFQLGFVYQNTGEWGTDLYLSNFRMYDITNGIPNGLISKSGNAKFTSFNESILPPSPKIYKSGEIYTQEIIEF